MILVADSDSSKTYWILQLPESQFVEFSTKGINPFYFPEKEIVKILNSSSDILEVAPDISEVHFFGAGCTNPDRREIVSNALSAVFKNAFIDVENKMIGCIYATCGSNRGITGILSTGSHSAYYDGEKVHYSKQGLGYILGDEGSATYFGKLLITSFLYEEMPKALRRVFGETFQIDKETVMSNVYQKPTSNLYLASFTDFMISNKSDPFIKSLLMKGFKEFLNESIIPFFNYKDVSCHFVGPIAFHFQEILIEVCQEYGIVPGKILNHPIREIYDFLLKREKEFE
jgi:N-acetylglucosamine kinase-like BadF-type ATPase